MRTFKKTTAALLCLSLMPTVAFANGSGEGRTIDIALISDSHVFSNMLYGRNDYARTAMLSEMRLQTESEALLEKALSETADAAPDVLLHCGDISGNGEYVNMELAKSKLDAFKTKLPDTKVFVTNGNHDINNSYAYDFSGEIPVPAKRVLPNDFREIFRNYGFGAGSELYMSEGNDVGGLSYVTDIADGVTLITLDTGKHSNDTSALYKDAQETGGALSEELLAWAAEKAGEAKAKGNLVLAMCHHAVVKHYSIDNGMMNTYMKFFTIDNWEHVADTLADAGVTAVFTGHKHNDDTAMRISPEGNTIYDIATPSLVEYPCAYKTVTITDDGNGSYNFKTDTHYINSLTYTDPETGAETDIDDLQTYAVEKSGFKEEMVTPAVNRLLTEKLYEIQQSENGLRGYLGEKLKCAPDQIGAALGQKLLDTLPPEGESLTVKNETVEAIIGKTVLSRKNGQIICENHAESEGTELKSTTTVSVDELASLVDQTIDALDAELGRTDLTKLYEPEEGTKELTELIASVLIPVLSQSFYLEEDSYVTGFDILSDAYNAFGKGNEAFSSDELTAQREAWRELVMGERFAGYAGSSLKDAVNDLLNGLNISKDDAEGVASLEDSKYKVLQKILLSVDVDMDRITTVEGDKTIIPVLLENLIGKPDNFGALLYRIWTPVLLAANSSIDKAAGRLLGGALRDVSIAMTTDENIPQDIKSSFTTGRDVKSVTAQYEQEGKDFTSNTETDNIASLWKLTLAPGSEPITSLNVRVNGHKAAGSDFTTPAISDGEIVTGIVVNHAGSEINSIIAIVNGTSVAAVGK